MPAPLGNRLRSRPRSVERRKLAGSSGKKADHAFRNNAEGLVARAAGLQYGAEFVDLSNGTGLDARLFEQSADGLVGDKNLFLCGFALDDLALLAVLGQC